MKTAAKLGGLCAALCLSTGAPAHAATIYELTLHGRLISQGPGPDDADLHVGDTLTVSARVSDKYVVDWGDTGYKVAGTWLGAGYGPGAQPLPTAGPEFFKVEGGGLTWGATADHLDGTVPFHVYDHADTGTKSLSGAYLIFKGNQVVSFGSISSFYPASGTAPALGITASISGYETWVRDLISCCDPVEFGPLYRGIYEYSPLNLPGSFGQFSIYQANMYSNYRYTPGFVGEWNYAASKVLVNGLPAVAPEPGTWFMLLIGFFGLGAMLRRQTARQGATDGCCADRRSPLPPHR